MKRFLLVLTAGVIFASAVFAQPPAQKGGAKKDDPFLSGPAFSLQDLKDAVGVIYEGRLKDAIDKRGIGFPPKPEELEELKKAGASAELIQLIMSKAPPPPPPPKATVAAPLVVHCSPPECEVMVNGKPEGRTQKGMLEIGALPIGDVVVDVRKAGYEGQQVTIAMREGPKQARSFVLSPTTATQQQIGKDLLAKMIARLGGDAGAESASMLTATGNASLWQAGGQRTDWKIVAHLKQPSNIAYLEVSGAGLRWWTTIRGSNSKADGTGKLRGSPVALEMEKLIRLYRDYQPSALAARILAEKRRLSAPSALPDASGQVTLRAAGDAESYKLTLNAEGTLTKVVFESASGLGSGLEVVYADYFQMGKAWYPKKMTIRFADQAQHGIELRFDEVTPAPKLSDKELRW